MKKINLLLTTSVFLFAACNQTNNKTTLTSAEETIDSVSHEISELSNTEEVPEKVSYENEKLTYNDDHDDLESSAKDSIIAVIALFKNKDINKIAHKISFPLQRPYPIPTIKNKEEFKKRFDEVFDKKLISKIANSKIQQWSTAGWRGTMLDDGIVWMSNSDGVITAVNYQSETEKKMMRELRAKDKQNLHPSLQDFESPTYKIKTKNYLIRIDRLKDDHYRYTSWKVNEKESSKPNIMIGNGVWEAEGNGGNHTITFVSGNYTYRIYRNIIGEADQADITLEVEKDGEIILTQDGLLMGQ